SQVAIRDMALSFAAGRIAPYALAWDEQKHLPVDVLREAAGLGMAGIYTRDEFGGSGMSRLDAALIFEALATGCPAISAYLSIHNLVTWMVVSFGSQELRARFVPALCSMEMLGSYCLTEPGAGSDAAALAATAVRDGDHYVVNGVKQFISGAGTSDVYLFMARTGEAGSSGISALIVEKDMPGLSFGVQEKKMGWNAQPTAAVILEDVRVPVGNRLSEEGQGFKSAMAGLDRGRLNAGAGSLGGAQGALYTAIARTQERKPFGKRTADFQNTQFQLADMETELAAARTFLWRAAASLDAKLADATTLCAMAKRVATDRGFEIANQALQLHGGYGYLADYGIEKIVRDLRVHQILEGTNEIMRLIVARSLVGRSSGN